MKGSDSSEPSCMERSDSPEPSCVSMKSDQSMEKPLKFKGGHTSPPQSGFHMKGSDSSKTSCVERSDSSEPGCVKRSDSSEPSCVKRSDSLEPGCVKRSDSSEPGCVKRSDSSEPGCVERSESPEPDCVKSSDSPERSCVSMKSDQSMEKPLKFKGGHTSAPLSGFHMKGSDSSEPSCVRRSDSSETSCVERSDSSEPGCVKRSDSLEPGCVKRSDSSEPGCVERSDSPEPSCVSMKSDQSMEKTLKFKGGHTSSPQSGFHMKGSDSSEPSCVRRSDSSEPDCVKRSDSPERSCVSMKSDQSMEKPLKFKGGHTSAPQSVLPEQSSETVNRDQTISVPPDGNAYCSPDSELAEVQSHIFKSNLRKKFECLYEGTSKSGNPTLLNEIYTELYITESEHGEILNEHEVRQIETQSCRASTGDTPIKCNDIFKPSPAQEKPIRTVLTKGVAGIGKTVTVQKFILDWAEGEANQEVHLIFPLPFREINLMKDQKLSLLDLFHVFFPESKEMDIFSDKYKVYFIFDGLDECRLSLDFHSSVRLCDVSESASVDVLLVNLIKGNLLPSALIWITSRPAAADLIPSGCVDRVTEVRGFSDPQKEEYFWNRISDGRLANRIISHLKSSRSLYIMCHIPVFCWISATVLERMLSEAESEEIPKTLTQMYTHLLIIQTNIKQKKDYEKNVKNEDMIFKLGKLAFEQLVKGNLIFYEQDLRECGIDVAEASVYSGLCTQIFREELGLHQGKVYCFIHLSIQEHLAALYTHLSLTVKRCNVFISLSFSFLKLWIYALLRSLSHMHQSAVNTALGSKNGHLDLFLRFLLGLSLESNQTLLQEVLTNTGNRSHSTETTVAYIQQKISENPSPEKFINLFHCLNELGDHSLEKRIQTYMQNGGIKQVKFSSSQWSALVFVLLTSENKRDVFDLKMFVGGQHTADEVLQNLLPVVKESRSAQLTDCGVTAKGCACLASALSANSSQLRMLLLAKNKLGDSGVKMLSAGLENPNCKLEVLRLECCDVRDEGCADLASALKWNSSHLRELYLTKNKLGDSGVELLSEVLENPVCKLKILRLAHCDITADGCAALASAVGSNPSHLRVLDLSWNKLEDLGVERLSAKLKNPHCKLETLWLIHCDMTAEGCAALASVLTSDPSHLRELDLYGNNLGDAGVKLLSAGLENPNCKLETLWLRDCGVTYEGCAALALALKSNPSHLKKLDLSENDLGHSGANLLSELKRDSHNKLEMLFTSRV